MNHNTETMKHIFWIVVAAFALVSCNGNAAKAPKTGNAATEAETPDMHAAETSLEGVYTGTFPAADCPGIEVRLTLRGDGSYEESDKYIDRAASFTETGTYAVTGNLLTLTPSDGSSPDYYKVEENWLWRTGGDKQPVSGPLADHYLLNKTE